MSSESDGQELTFNLPFLKVVAKGSAAIQAVCKPVLIIAVALALAIIILALSYSHPEWQSLVMRPFSWFKKLF
ncbi:hypothetical protein [Bradyrhizobium sp. UNPF46]|uniref:hypothetical protein n=1 Tax=Bradyrhizobium sp. UNPF46 TaxID=1141168 RepID=UPI0011504C1E|nr:hypothetical protein [Bradyrhizobium sp. UNPF46]